MEKFKNNIPIKNEKEAQKKELMRKLNTAESTLNNSIKELNEVKYYHKDSVNFYSRYIYVDDTLLLEFLNR